jgi:hypothetical protein
MKRRSLFSMIALGLACAVMFAVSASAQAATIIVQDDSGGGTVDVNGTAAGADITNFNTSITEINGSPVSINLTLDTLHITDVGGVITGTGTKTIGVAGNEAVLLFSITSGIVNLSHFNMDGVITFVVPPGTVTSGGNTYDFSQMAPMGLISLAIDKTGTNFANVVNHPGTSATHSGFGLQQSTVPEPASMALLGIGMTGFLAFRRLFKRTSVA